MREEKAFHKPAPGRHGPMADLAPIPCLQCQDRCEDRPAESGNDDMIEADAFLPIDAGGYRQKQDDPAQINHQHFTHPTKPPLFVFKVELVNQQRGKTNATGSHLTESIGRL